MSGSCDWQDVEFYDGSDATFDRAFVDRYQGAAGMACSGTLISSDLFLTVNHCGQPSTINFNCQLDGTQAYPSDYAAANAAAAARCDPYSVTEIVYASDVTDLIVARLDRLPGSKYRWVVPSIRLPSVGEEVAVFQHPQQRLGVERRKVVAFGAVTGSDATNLEYDDVDVYGGSSGSGVLDQFGRLVGVVEKGSSSTAFGQNMQYFTAAQPVRQAMVAVWRPAIQGF